MQTTTKICLFLLAILIFPSLKAQENLSITKVIKTNSLVQKTSTVNNLKMWLIQNTNAQVCGQCEDKQMVIIDGQMPLTLSDNPYDIEYQFNGGINYQLVMDYSSSDIKLTFKNLQHYSNKSINGLELDYGQLLTDGSTSESVIFRNFDYLLEDFGRIKRFETDKKIAKEINDAALLGVDNILAEK